MYLLYTISHQVKPVSNGNTLQQ